MRTRRNRGIALFFIFVLTFALFTPLVFAETKTIAVTPFKINAANDLSYLREGIQDMLTSRLTVEGKSRVIERSLVEAAFSEFNGVVTGKNAVMIGERAGADYVLFGSMTVFGENVSIDAQVVDVSGDGSSLKFIEQCRGIGAVVPKIDMIAAKVKQKLFQINTEQKPEAAANTVVPSQKTPEPPLENKPVEQSKKDLEEERVVVTSSPSVEPSGDKMDVRGGSWRSRAFPYLFNGMAAGDVNGDGKTEIVLLTLHEIYITSLSGNRLNRMRRIANHSFINQIGIDVADINANGIAEIFVTSLDTQRNGSVSFVLEWNGRSYEKIVEDSPFSFRICRPDGKTPRLFGRRMISHDPLSGPVVALSWKNGKYVPGSIVVPMKKAHMLGFAFGDVLNRGNPVAAIYDKTDTIFILDPSGSVLWKKDEKSGGSDQFLLLPKSDQGQVENRQYLPMRLLIEDVNEDGSFELVSAKNKDLAKRILGTFRKFTGAEIDTFSWSGSGFVSVWKATGLPGYVSDMMFMDIDGNGVKDLVASVVIKTGTIITKPSSVLMAFPMKK